MNNRSGSLEAASPTKKRKTMKKLNWNVILKVVIAVASAVLGALGANAMA